MARNEGMARVCARRAAGAAIAYWLQFNSRPGWRADAVSRLRHLEADPSFPPQIRDAARRLAARVTEQFTSPYFSDPLVDADVIIRHLLG
jgi:hypothetical protein